MFDPVFLAKLNHRAITLPGEFRLEAARFVVNAGMDDSAVPSGLMQSQIGFLFQKEYPEAWLPAAQSHGCGEAHDSSSYDCAVKRFRAHKFFEMCRVTRMIRVRPTQAACGYLLKNHFTAIKALGKASRSIRFDAAKPKEPQEKILGKPLFAPLCPEIAHQPFDFPGADRRG
jgi:hypothetical protein